MREITTYPEREEWQSSRDRIGFIGSYDTMSLQNDIWTMELYRKKDGGYSIFITSDSDESWWVCDFEDNENLNGITSERRVDFMVEIVLRDGQSGYDAVGEYIRRYWEHNITDDVVVSIGTSYDGNTYDIRKEIASPSPPPLKYYDGGDIEFLHDWWEGEKYIKLFGIKTVGELDIDGGIYEEA